MSRADDQERGFRYLRSTSLLCGYNFDERADVIKEEIHDEAYRKAVVIFCQNENGRGKGGNKKEE